MWTTWHSYLTSFERVQRARPGTDLGAYDPQMPSHPFRYYGTDPGDWYDQGFVLVRFTRVPDDEAKKAIGAIVDSADLPGKSRRWRGAVLSISLDGAHGTTFHRLQRTLLEAHQVVPIDRAVNHLARAATEDDWESWSLEQGWPDEDLYDPNDMSVWALYAEDED
jgi:hypothetical protein